MAGNVCEWVEDWYGPYPDGSARDPGGPRDGTRRVLRGGSWFFPAVYARSAERTANPPGLRNHNLGFRVVLRPPAHIQHHRRMRAGKALR